MNVISIGFKSRCPRHGTRTKRRQTSVIEHRSAEYGDRQRRPLKHTESKQQGLQKLDEI